MTKGDNPLGLNLFITSKWEKWHELSEAKVKMQLVISRKQTRVEPRGNNKKLIYDSGESTSLHFFLRNLQSFSCKLQFRFTRTDNRYKDFWTKMIYFSTINKEHVICKYKVTFHNAKWKWKLQLLLKLPARG